MESLQEQSERLVEIMQKLIEVAQDYLEKFENDRERILQKSLRNSRRKIHKVIRDLSHSPSNISDSKNSSSKIDRLARKERDETIANQQKTLKDLQQKIIKSHDSYSLIEDYEQGDTVKLISYNKKAVLQKVYHDKAEAVVRLGQLELQVALEDLEFVSRNESSGLKSCKLESKINLDPAPSMRLDLRGYNGDDALVELDQFLDKAVVTGLNSFKVITGKGVLGKIVSDYLANNLEKKWSVRRLTGAFVISYD